jgi:hypothetical protein
MVKMLGRLKSDSCELEAGKMKSFDMNLSDDARNAMKPISLHSFRGTAELNEI